MDAELSKRAKAAGTSFGLFKAQLAREGHKIRGDVDYRSMDGLSAAADALRAQYLKDQDSLDEYARSGGYQDSLSFEDEGGEAPANRGRKPSESRGIGSEVVASCDGEYYRGKTEVHDDGTQLLVERLDDDFQPLQTMFDQVYLDPASAWNAWDEYVSGLSPQVEHVNGKQTVGGKDYIFTVTDNSVTTDDGTSETTYYFEVVGDRVETNGSRSSQVDAWNAIDLWVRNRFSPKVVEAPLPKPEPADKPKRSRSRKK